MDFLAGILIDRLPKIMEDMARLEDTGDILAVERTGRFVDED